MKYGTILRVARVILVVVIAVMMLFPLVGSIASINAEKMTSGIESRYSLEYVNDDETIGEKMIEVNLNLIENLNDNFYVGIDDQNPDQFKKCKNVTEAADYMMTEKAKGSKIASIYDSDKKICLQKSIQYHNGISSTVVTGMKLPDNVMGMASFSISLRLVSDSANFNIPFGTSKVVDGYLIITTDIPDLLLILSNSIQHDMAFRVDVTIMGVASFNVNLNMDTAPIIGCTKVSDQKLTFTDAAIGSPIVLVGMNKGMTYQYDIDIVQKTIKTDKIIMKSNISKPLHESIELNPETGNIPVAYYNDLSGQIQYDEIDGEYYDDIVNILKTLEGYNV